MKHRKKHAYPQQTRVYEFATSLIGLTCEVMRYRHVSHDMVFQRYDFTESIAQKKKKVFEKRRESLIKAFRYALVMENRYSGTIFVKLLKLYDLLCYQMNMAQTYMLAAYKDKRFDDAVKYTYFAYTFACNRDIYWRRLMRELTDDSLMLDKECPANDLRQVFLSLDLINCMLRSYPQEDDSSEKFGDFLISNLWLELAFSLDRASFHLEKARILMNSSLADEIEIVLNVMLGYMPKPCMWSQCADEGDTEMVEYLVNEGFRHCEERRHELEDLTGRLSVFVKGLKKDASADGQREEMPLRMGVHSKTKIKKRGGGVLEKQVDELLKRLEWPTDISINKIKQILDTENCDRYKPTNVRAIRDTDAWDELQKKKQREK